MLKTKSVKSPIDRDTDGLRILVTRFRGRRMPTTRYDVWMPSLGPSEPLMKGFLAGRISWQAYTRRYRAELRMASALDRTNATIKNHGQKFTLRLIERLARKGNVTLLCHCAEDEQHCHRHLLREAILKSAI
jgi:uncharacterized protein YeaO (DUF488 family)